MGYTIIYDRRGIRLKNGNYILMLQMGTNNTYEIVNGREISEKYWNNLCLYGEKPSDISCSMEKMRERISVLAEGYGDLAKSRGNFFHSREELQKYLEGGLKRPYTFDEYRAAGNTFQVSYWDIEQQTMKYHTVRSEEEMVEKLNEFAANPNCESVSVQFSGRELHPIIDRKRVEKEPPQSGFVICAENIYGSTAYFKRKTSRRLIFVPSVQNAMIFRKESAAQKYISNLPATKETIQYSVKEYSLADQGKSPYARNSSQNVAQLNQGKETEKMEDQKIIAVVKAPYEKPKTMEIGKGLEALQNLVGGDISGADLPNMDDVLGFCNDEGLLIGLKPNFYRPEYGDGIVGTAVFVGNGENGESVSLTPEQVKRVTTYLEENSVESYNEFLYHIETDFRNYKPKKQAVM